MCLKFPGLAIAVYATVPDSPSPSGEGVWYQDCWSLLVGLEGEEVVPAG